MAFILWVITLGEHVPKACIITYCITRKTVFGCKCLYLDLTSFMRISSVQANFLMPLPQ